MSVHELPQQAHFFVIFISALVVTSRDSYNSHFPGPQKSDRSTDPRFEAEDLQITKNQIRSTQIFAGESIIRRARFSFAAWTPTSVSPPSWYGALLLRVDVYFRSMHDKPMLIVESANR